MVLKINELSSFDHSRVPHLTTRHVKKKVACDHPAAKVNSRHVYKSTKEVWHLGKQQWPGILTKSQHERLNVDWTCSQYILCIYVYMWCVWKGYRLHTFTPEECRLTQCFFNSSYRVVYLCLPLYLWEGMDSRYKSITSAREIQHMYNIFIRTQQCS